ncbi:hypothetical protein [Corallococcus exiguus]|uniref:Uncharacterized protein n=1 Tax=Corallococcus exiguus TaxID=83462 RepID=A0A7X5BS34_9BACT|nr:hypothetical protein [Corallococcus exiguus]NBC41474.1 hypothetical protein [Corallococcus exiguus]TNV61691.1 hypothetical protein FH620_20380 [Corallococcus exiguus]
MSGPDFFQTHMGQRFYEGTMPALVRELKRLNDNMERMVAVAEQLAGQKEAPSVEPREPSPGDSEGP